MFSERVETNRWDHSKTHLLQTSHYRVASGATNCVRLHELCASGFCANLHYRLRRNIALLPVKRLSHLPMKHQGSLLSAGGRGLAVARCFSTSSEIPASLRKTSNTRLLLRFDLSPPSLLSGTPCIPALQASTTPGKA